MSIKTVNEHKFNEFIDSFRGRVVRRGDDDYDNARTIWNAMIDRYPAMIAQCMDARDVMTAVAFARENDLPTSIKSSGHNVAGNALCDDGLVIDLSSMKYIQIDPEARIARAGAGVTWGEFDRATQQYGLATTGGLVSTTSIAGFTLGGGMGWLERKYGLTCDNLLAAEVVTAEGKLVRASPDENPDLFWALRGGGGNFGIVTEFTYRLHPVGPTVLGGMLVWPLKDAERIYQFYREFTADLPEELTTMASPITAPPAPFIPSGLHGKPCIAIVGCYAGSLEEGKRTIAPVRDLSPAVDLFDEVPYTALQTILDDISAAGRRNYWKNEYLSVLSDEAIQVIISSFEKVPSSITHVDVHDLGGAIRRVGETETAFSHRDARYVCNIVTGWTDPADDQNNVSWTRELYSALQPYSMGASYVNFMASEGEQSVKASYGSNYQRLTEVKHKYDPTNFFRYNQNIKPG